MRSSGISDINSTSALVISNLLEFKLDNKLDHLIPDVGILHHLDEQLVIYSKNSTLVVSTHATKKIKKFAWIPLPNVYYRLFRKGVHKVILQDDRLFVIINEVIIVLCLDTLDVLASVKLRGKRPLCIEKYKDGIVYGEYYSNPARKAIKIIYIDGKGVERCLAELRGVRHVHSVTYNSYLNKFLVCTGDLDDESCMFAFSLDFRTYTKLLFGIQQYRIVQPACYKNKIFFGSDIPDSQNAIFEYDIDTGNVTEICKVPGPVFYSLSKGADLFFATVVEPSAINDQKFCHIFHINEKLNSRNIGHFEKDMIPMRFGQYGQIMFPRYDLTCDRKIFYSQFATKHHLRTGSYDFT